MQRWINAPAASPLSPLLCQTKRSQGAVLSHRTTTKQTLQLLDGYGFSRAASRDSRDKKIHFYKVMETCTTVALARDTFCSLVHGNNLWKRTLAGVLFQEEKVRIWLMKVGSPG